MGVPYGSGKSATNYWKERRISQGGRERETNRSAIIGQWFTPDFHMTIQLDRSYIEKIDEQMPRFTLRIRRPIAPNGSWLMAIRFLFRMISRAQSLIVRRSTERIKGAAIMDQRAICALDWPGLKPKFPTTIYNMKHILATQILHQPDEPYQDHSSVLDREKVRDGLDCHQTIERSHRHCPTSRRYLPSCAINCMYEQ